MSLTHFTRCPILIIKYPTIFRYYAQLKEETDGFLPGKYEVASNMNYDALLSANDGSVEASLVLDNKSFSDKKAKLHASSSKQV